MSEDKKTYRTISEEELNQYLEGNLSPSEAHDLERKALHSEFEGDALEGWEQNNHNQIAEDINILRTRLASKTAKNNNKIWMRIAAIGLLLITGGSAIWILTNSLSEQEVISMKLEEKANEPEQESTEKAVEMVENDQSQGADVQTKPVVPPEDDMFKIEEKDDMSMASKQPDLKPLLTQAREEDNSVEKFEEPLEIASFDVEDIDLTITNSDETMPSINKPEAMLTGKVAGVKVEPSDNFVSPPQEADLEELVVMDYKMEKKETLDGGTSQSNSSNDQIKIRGTSSFSSRSNETGAVARSSRSSSEGSRVVYGIVTSRQDNEPLPGVTVLVKNATRGTITNLNGEYWIGIEAGDENLIFDFIGFSRAESPLPQADTLDVVLSEDLMALEEVVVIGYGTIGREESIDITYQSATPKDGISAFKKYIEKNKVCPESAKANNIKGVVRLKVSISNTGNITDISVKKSLGYGCDEEAVRLVKEGPKWNAAIRSDQRIDSSVILRIKFP